MSTATLFDVRFNECSLVDVMFLSPNTLFLSDHKKSSEEANNLRKKSKRMAMTTSRFRGLTPEELLKVSYIRRARIL